VTAASEDIDQLMQSALAHHREGRRGEAEAVYRRILQQHPDHAHAMHLLGMLVQRRGDGEEALELLRRAVDLHPDEPNYRFGLAITLSAQARWPEAIAAYREAVRLRPQWPEVWMNLGSALKAHGDAEEAQSAFRQALVLKPDLAEGWHRLAVLQESVGRHEAALESHQRALALQASRADFHVAFGNTLRAVRSYDAADAAYGAALRIDPNNAVAYHARGRMQYERGDLDAARTAFMHAARLRPGDAAIHLDLGVVARELGEHKAALAHYNRALEITPDDARAHYYRGVALQELGQLTEARAAYRAALERKPDYTEVFRALVWHQRYGERDVEVESMERLWKRQQLDDERRIPLAFALGKVCEDLGEYDAAFRYFETGNRLKRATYRYDVAEEATYVERLMAVFDAQFFAARSDWGCADTTPIVICGMPRSGTTLAEQILASHPEVAGVGEVQDLPNAVWRTLPALRRENFPEGARELARADFARLGEAYVERLRAHVGAKSARICDKLPGNFFQIGMLRVMLPHARVIHCRRNALDTCWSIYKQLFGGRQYFAYDLAELGHYYRIYQRLMAHWAAVLPGHLLEFDYEAVVDDQEAATRRLLEFCGLEWDPRCLAFHETDRAVKTASLSQVRRPVYGSSVGIAEKYAEHLAPLINALEVRR